MARVVSGVGYYNQSWDADNSGYTACPSLLTCYQLSIKPHE